MFYESAQTINGWDKSAVFIFHSEGKNTSFKCRTTATRETSSFPRNHFYLVTACLHLRFQDQGRQDHNKQSSKSTGLAQVADKFLTRVQSCPHAELGTLDPAIRDEPSLFASQQPCCFWWNGWCELSPMGYRPAFVPQSIKCHYKAWEGAKINDRQFAQFSKWLQHIRFYVTCVRCVFLCHVFREVSPLLHTIPQWLFSLPIDICSSGCQKIR